MDSYDFLVKFLLIGNAGTGKTCILRSFLGNSFKENTLHTIGVEFGTKMVICNEKSVKLQIWDTAGQERFQSVTRSYYRGAMGALIVYDVTDRESFNKVIAWLSIARNHANPGLITVLIGNKIDLPESSRQVTELEGRQLAEENKMSAFIETSAKNGMNINDAFNMITEKIISDASLNSKNPNACVNEKSNGNYFSPRDVSRILNEKYSLRRNYCSC